MKRYIKKISIALVFILIFTTLPIQPIDVIHNKPVYAEGSPSTVDIRYDNFANTENLQVNGNALIENNAIMFESGGGTGESVFTKQAITLGDDLSFSTAFTFKNISPVEPTDKTKGGFTFTLQSVGNNVTANSFQHEDVEQSFSVSLVSNYNDNDAAMLKEGTLLVASERFKIAYDPATTDIRCETSSTPYGGGDYFGGRGTYLDSHAVNGPLPEYYNIRIAYVSEEKTLYMFFYNPIDGYQIFSWDADLSLMLTNQVYVGFMGSMGDAGNKSEISSWYFKNDTSLYDEFVVDYNMEWLTESKILSFNSDLNNITSGLNLRGQGEFIGTIDWTSSNMKLINTEYGFVTRPGSDEGDRAVTLTATLKSGVVEKQKIFNCTVKALDRTNVEIVQGDYSWLTDGVLLRRGGGSSISNITGDLYFPTLGPDFTYRSFISWTSDKPDVIKPDGTVTRPSYADGNQEVTLTADISRGAANTNKIFIVTVKAVGMADGEALNTDYTWLCDPLVLGGNAALNNVTENLNLPVLGYAGSSISWVSNKTEVIATDGAVVRPESSIGDQVVILTATISRDSQILTKEFNITVKALGATDAEAVNADYSGLTDAIVLDGNSALNNVTANLRLPVLGNNGSNIGWTSSDTGIVGTDGTVIRPTYTDGDKDVVLTATITNGALVGSKVFHIKVKALDVTDLDLVNADYSWLTETMVFGGNGISGNITENLNFPTIGKFGSAISWSSTSGGAITIDGTVNRPDRISGNQAVTVTATITKGMAAVVKDFNVTVIALGLTDQELAAADYMWLTNKLVRKENSGLDNVTGDIYFPNIGINGSSVTWTSYSASIVAMDGTVNRPTYNEGDQVVYIRASIIYGSVELSKNFRVVVKALGATDQEAVNIDYLWLTDLIILSGNNLLRNVTGNLSLPAYGNNGSSIGWTSSDTAVVNTDGTVTRPLYADGNREVTLTASIIRGTEAMEKVFQLKVRAEGLSDAEMVQHDNSWLSEALMLNNNTALDNVTTDLFFPTRGERGSFIWCESLNLGVIAADGKVARPSYSQGDQVVTVNLHIWSGGSTADRAFIFTVKAKDATDAELVNGDKLWLTNERLLNSNSDMDHIVTNLIFPTRGINGSDITWTSNYAEVVNANGIITRPSVGDQMVTLTATISKGEATDIKRFYIMVIGLEKSDTQKVIADRAWLTDVLVLNENSALDNVTADLYLPTLGNSGSTIIWTSSDTAVLNTNGAVTRPTNIYGDKNVVLTAMIMTPTASTSKIFNIKVIAFEPSDIEEVKADIAWLTDTRVLNGNSALNNIQSDLNLPTLGSNGSAIMWTISDSTAVSTSGTVTKPPYAEGDKSVKLTAVVSKGAVTMEKEFNILIKRLAQTEVERVNDDYAWLTEVIVLKENSALDQVATDLNLPILGKNGSNIAWTISDTAVVSMNGTVTRALFKEGDKRITLSASISSGTVAPLTKTFTIVVKAFEASEVEKVEADYAWLTDAMILNENSAMNSVTLNMNLPDAAPMGSSIIWTSSNGAVIDVTGKVARPTFTQGDKLVTLVAAISNGTASKDKTFSITVKALEQSEVEKVEADYVWLSSGLVLNENTASNSVTLDLHLPNVAPMGSSVTWTSSNSDVVSATGKVVRPTFTQGDQNITLTAVIKMGATIRDKQFSITVKANYMTYEEMIARDYEWLTEDRILGNNSSLASATENLSLPVKGMDGVAGSNISWASSNHGFVTIGGYVYRPMFHLGDQTVTLTATISKGTVSLKKNFIVTVKCLALTDEESVNESANWLKSYNTLGGNLSKYSVTQDLSWPISGPYDTNIVWRSNLTSMITNEGKVTRPQNKAGSIRVIVTATVSKGLKQVSVPIEYIVLEEPDLIAPIVTSTTPENNATGVLWDAKNIVITYSENIILNQNSGIVLSAADNIQHTVRVENNQLIITPYSILSSGENRLQIPLGAITDAAGNPSGAYELSFTMEEKLVKNIEVISSYPKYGEKDVDVSNLNISVRFDSDVIVTKGPTYQIYLRKKGDYFTTGYRATVTGNTVTRNFSGLDPGAVYELVIPAGIVQDRFLNKNSYKIIEFRTKGLAEPVIPEIKSIYPAYGQSSVSVNPNIEVVLSGVLEPKIYKLKLVDLIGNEVQLYAPYTLDMFETKLVFKPKQSLKPNTEYLLHGTIGSDSNSTQKKFMTQFTTGLGPEITKTSPSTGDWNASSRGIVEIQFNTSVTKGPNFNDIRFEDYTGEAVDYTVEETGSKVVLKALSELGLYMPYTVDIPSGAYQNSAGVGNTQNKISFYTTKEKLPNALEASYLDVSNIGFVGKYFKLSVDTYEMASWQDSMRFFGYGPVSYEWRIDGQFTSNRGLDYHNFTSPGEHEITLTAIDRYGFAYSVNKTIEIQALQNVTMSIKDSGEIMTINTSETGLQSTLNFELRLEQQGQFIYGENIGVKRYKDGVLQPFSNYGGGGTAMTSKYGDETYKFAYTPEVGDSGTYEMEFTYQSANGEQVIRQPFIVTSKNPSRTDVFRFRLYTAQGAMYYENLNYVYVVINGKRMRANKELYTYNGSTFPVYALREPLQTNVYYDFKVENWFGTKDYMPFYIGKDTNSPAIFSGYVKSAGAGMEIKQIVYNLPASDQDRYYLYFKGMNTKLVFDVIEDWGVADPGYYEIAVMNFKDPAFRKTDTEYNIIFNQAYDSNNEIQKITVSPGTQLKSDSEQYLIRMVSAQGYQSDWRMCPKVNVLPVPSVLGKALNISVQDRDYVIDWPTVFDGPVGASIGALDGIPVVGGGNFGMGGHTPKFEGELDDHDDVYLTMSFKGDYGDSNKTSTATKLKKVKKVTVVGYEFEIELDGELWLIYNEETEEWYTKSIYVDIDGDGTKSFNKGYEFLGIGFTAGVNIGTRVGGILIVKDGTDYSGVVKIRPHAALQVNGDFAAAKVVGSLEAAIPAEIHFPTNYIGADITVDALIKGYALLWEKTLYEKSLYKVHWDNGNPKVTLLELQESTGVAGVEKNTGAQLMSRDYLERQSVWLGESAYTYAMERPYLLVSSSDLLKMVESNPKIAVMMENIFPNTETALVINGAQKWLVWNDDNQGRDAINRTQLRIAVYKDGAWSSPEWIYDDGTADFDPSVAAIGNGVLMAWHNINRTMNEDEELNGMLESSEISVTESIYTTDGSHPNRINLTDDDKLDHSPRITAGENKALLVWTKSEGLSLNMNGEEALSPQPRDQLFFSEWHNNVWTSPSAIEMEPATVMDSSLAMAGEEGLLLYTLDMDNDVSTGEDREVFARLYDGQDWGSAIRLTVNELNDSSPKAVNVNGKWFITWLNDGKILFKTGLDGETQAEAKLDNIQSDYRLNAKEGEQPLAALVFTQPGEDKSLGMYSAFYDFEKGEWSDKIGLATGNQYTSAISTSFDMDGKLTAAYTQADIISEVKTQMVDGKEELVETKSVSDKVDLKLLTYSPIHDLALQSEDGMLLSTEFPLAGTVTTVYVTLQNNGDFTESVSIDLYDGNPEEGGVKIAETASQLISARSSKEVEIEWLVGSEEKMEYELYAVVRPSDGIQETSTENNSANIMVFTSDIAISGVTVENVAAGDYCINVTVANKGSQVLTGAKLWLEEESGGEVMASTPLESIDLGEKTALTYMVSSKDKKNMRVRITLPEGVNEADTDNNIRSFLLEPGTIELKSMNIGPMEEHVRVESDIRFDFNMTVGKGTGFDQIKLMDEELNIVDITTAIDNSTLTIKPKNPMSYGTEYRLTIPKDALGDGYGHALEKSIDLGFTTITSNPEIVSAYPGANMNNAALDTAISLRFNQNVIKGNEFSHIALYKNTEGLDAKEIPVSASISGEFLTLYYSGSLGKNTTYTVEIPRGAVENVQGEIQHEDYILAFTTGNTIKSNGTANNETDGGSANDEEIVNVLKKNDEISNISTIIDGRQEKINIRIDSDVATINLAEQAADIFTGDKNVILNSPVLPNVNEYHLVIPADLLTNATGKGSLTLNTEIGSITIPSAMLSSMKALSGKTANIKIAVGDKFKLPLSARTAIGNHPLIQLTLTIDGQEISWNNPGGRVTVSIPYTPSRNEVESPESIVLWHINTNGNLTSIPNGRYDQSSGKVTFTTSHFSYYALGYNKVDFKDVVEGAWYEDAVNFIAARKITDGTGSGNYSPGKKLTRSEFIVLLMRAYGIAPDTNPTDNFADAGNAYYTGYLAAAKRLGISQGIGGNLYGPDKILTRQEMFTLLYNTLKVIKQLPKGNSGNRLDSYSDVGQISSWAKEATLGLFEGGIISGNAGKLRPMTTTTRAEMAQVLYKLLGNSK